MLEETEATQQNTVMFSPPRSCNLSQHTAELMIPLGFVQDAAFFLSGFTSQIVGFVQILKGAGH